MCGHCNKRRGTGGKSKAVFCEATKQLLVVAAPRVLTLHLKRFEQAGHSGHVHKVSRHVPFPDMLDLAPFCEYVNDIFLTSFV